MEKDKLSQNSKRGQAATYLSTLEDKTMNILDKNESTEQSPNNVYFTQKSKGQRVSNGQNEFFIKWRTSYAVNGHGNQKKISLLRQSLRSISKKVQTREPTVILLFNYCN